MADVRAQANIQYDLARWFEASSFFARRRYSAACPSFIYLERRERIQRFQQFRLFCTGDRAQVEHDACVKYARDDGRARLP